MVTINSWKFNSFDHKRVYICCAHLIFIPKRKNKGFCFVFLAYTKGGNSFSPNYFKNNIDPFFYCFCLFRHSKYLEIKYSWIHMQVIQGCSLILAPTWFFFILTALFIWNTEQIPMHLHMVAWAKDEACCTQTLTNIKLRSVYRMKWTQMREDRARAGRTWNVPVVSVWRHIQPRCFQSVCL